MTPAPTPTPDTEALVERLRVAGQYLEPFGEPLADEAAAELTRLQTALAKAEADIQAAVAAERERCAKVCETFYLPALARVIREGAAIRSPRTTDTAS